MSRTRKPAYRVEVSTRGNPGSGKWFAMSDFAWKMQDYGKPTEENLAKFVAKYNESFMPGGVNEQAGEQIGQIVAAELIRQSDGVTMALWVDVSYVERKVAERKAIA